MRQWKRYGWVGAAALVAAGCGGSSGKPGEEEARNEPVQQEARLESFGDCDSLERYIEDTATKQMRVSLESLKRQGSFWPWYDRGGGIPVADDGSGTPPPMPSAPTEGGAGSGGPDNHTGTNNQVAGVHEADFVQNDGTRIFVLSANRLYVHRSWPAEQLTLAASMEIEGWPREMLLDKERNRLVITSQVYEERQGTPGTNVGGGAGAPVPIAVDCAGLYCGYGYGNTVKVTVLDVSDVEAPQVVRQVYLPGGYTNARRVEGTARLVLSDQFRWPEGVRFYPDYSEDLYKDRERFNAAVDTLIRQNEQRIREQSLADWLPAGRHVDAAGNVTRLAPACGEFYRTNAPTGLGFVTVATLDLEASAAETSLGRTSLIAEPGEVYASRDALYLAANHWWWWPEAGQTDSVYLHKFDIREAGRTTYMGSGTVEGHIVNQFAMDEHEGVLRVAVTVTSRVASGTNPFTTQTVNRVVTLAEEGGHLKVFGRTEDLAPGERIFSARFVGKKGYVVTFRQVDPLFTFDLSDPTNPRKVGELKIPGFSTYIHPVGDTHLLTLGEHRDETGGWQGRALKLSLFDVTDLANPRETFTQLIGSQNSYSEALYSHKAFNYFAAKGLLAIPYTDWTYNPTDYWSGFRSELRVFRVDTAAGFTPVGAISMGDVYRTFNRNDWSWYWQPMVRRSVMADDYVYAITDAGVRVANVNALQTPLSTVLFQAPPTR